VDRRLARGGVEGAAERLAVDGNDLAAGDFLDGGDPREQTLLELPRLDCGEDGVEAVARRDAVSQVEELGEPLATLT
jgi:hypothetical protein